LSVLVSGGCRTPSIVSTIVGMQRHHLFAKMPREQSEGISRRKE
jgi:hypothetical protein